MASSYLEGYGAADAKREKTIRWIVLSILGSALLATILFFTFRDYSQESQIRNFLEAVQRNDLRTAYTFWGCSVESPCRDYPFNKFSEDWSPGGQNAKAISGGKLSESERCGTGLIAVISPNGRDEVALWVERSTNVLGYAPYRECPEPKLRVLKWIKMKFGAQPPPLR